MAAIWKDGDTGVSHIRIYDAMTLCGIMNGWTRRGDVRSKVKWGITCESCQEELEELRRIRKNTF